MKAGVKKPGWDVGKVMKAIWKLLDECPAGRDVYEIITASNLYPLPYCDNCANRAEIVWSGFIQFVKYLQGLQASKCPLGKSLTSLQGSH